MCVALLLLSFTSSEHIAYAQRQLLAYSLVLLWFIVLFFLVSAIVRLVSQNNILVEILSLGFHGLCIMFNFGFHGLATSYVEAI
jgi:hypothetical protein